MTTQFKFVQRYGNINDDYIRAHADQRKTFIDNLIICLADRGVNVNEDDIKIWLFCSAERGLLVPWSSVFNGANSGIWEEIDSVFQDLLTEDCLNGFPRTWYKRLDKEVENCEFPYSVLDDIPPTLVAPYKKGWQPHFSTDHLFAAQSKRDTLINLLTQMIGRNGLKVNPRDVERWLIFTAKRALLIDPAGSSLGQRLFYKPVFSRIDGVLKKFYPDNFYTELIPSLDGETAYTKA